VVWDLDPDTPLQGYWSGTREVETQSVPSTQQKENIVRTQFARILTYLGVLTSLFAATVCSASTPYLGTPFSEPGTEVDAVNFDAGSAGDAYSVANPVSPASTSYRNTPVPISTCPDPGTGYAVGVNIVPGDYFVYTTNFTTGGSFDIGIRAATANQDGTGASGRFIHIDVDGVNVTGSINLAATGSWNSYATTTISSVAISAGAHKITYVIETPVGEFNTNYLTFTQHVTHTYYVSNSGSDSNNGTSTSTPWQTLAMVNSAALGPGDTVLFQRGGNWHEVLNPTVSGRPGNPITFADYGTGAKPTFWGSNQIPVNDSAWQPQGSNVYTLSYATQVNDVLANQQFLIDIWSGGSGGTGAVVRDPTNTPNCWKWSGGTLTISTATGDDPRTDGKQYDVCVRDNVICNGSQATGNYSSYLVFRNIIVDETASQVNPSLGYGIRLEGNPPSSGLDILVDSCEAYRNGRHAFAAIDVNGVTFSNCVGGYPEPNVDQGYTTYVSFGSQGANGTETSVYNNCTSIHSGDTWNPQDFEYEAFVDHGASLGSVLVNNLQAIDVTGGNGDGDFCSFDGAGYATVIVTGGQVYNERVDTDGSGVVINGMNISGPIGELDANSTNCVFENMVMIGCTEPNWYHTAICSRGDGNIFRFNTIVLGSTAPTNTTAIALANEGSLTATNQQIYGNIMLTTGLAMETWSSNTFNTAMYKDNIYQSGATFQQNFGTTDTLAQWQALGFDTGSFLVSNPLTTLFNNAAGGDYSLIAGSPAIDAANIGTVTPAMPTIDYLGNPRLVNSAYDIGAYEYQVTTPQAPAINSASSASGNVGSSFSYQITAAHSPTSYAATGLPAGVSINTSTGVISGTPTATGTSTATLTATNSVGTSANFALTIAISPALPAITSASTASGTMGVAFSFTVTASNSPTGFGAIGLPAGLTINTTTGVISGTPTTAGTSSVTVTATNAGGTATGALTITIALAKPTINSSLTASGTQNQAFSYQISGTGSPTSYNATGLPAGVTVNTTSGLISGTPTVNGSFSVALSATNSAGTGTATLALTIAAPPPAPVVNSSLTSSGTVGIAYSYTITATHSPTSYNATGLPGGLSINTSTGVISGTPTTAGTSSVTIGATNGGGTGTATLALTINPPVPAITSTLTATGYLGSAFTYQITGSNSPISYSASGLPAGLSINTSTGAITGTPSGTTGTSNVTIGAHNAGGTGTATLVITIDAALTGQLNGSVGAPASTVNLTTEGTADWAHWGSEGSGNDDHKNVTSLIGWSAGPTCFTYGSNAISYLWTDGSSNWNGQAQATGFYYSPGGNNAFTITAPADSTTRVLKVYAGTNSGASGYLTASLSDGSAPTYTSATLGSSSNSEYTLTYKAGSAGQTLTVQWVAVSGQVTIQSADLAISTNPVPVITSSLTATGTVGTAFSYTIAASNSPSSYSATGLPAGLSVNTTTGVISGTPTASGSSSVTISATNAGGTGSATLALTVNPAKPVINSTLTASGTVSTAFSYSITATNSPTSYSASGLPAGLSVNTSTGVISGTPTASGTSSVTIGATNAGGTGAATLSITIAAAGGSAPVINSSLSASATAGATFTYSITATNTPTSYNATGLPDGLSVNTSTGAITGTPTTAATSNVTISATNAGGTGSATLVITVAAANSGNNVYAIFTPGTTVTNGGADSYGNAYNSTLVGKTIGYNNSAFTFGPVNAPDAYTSQTVALPAGNYTQLNMLATAVGGIVTNQVFTVNYTDGSSQSFTINMSDWRNPQGFAGETTVLSMPNYLNTSGTATSGTTCIYGYTFNLNGKSVASISMPNTRQVIAFGFSPSSYNVNAIFTLGTPTVNGGADSYTNAYEASLLGTTATYNSSTITFGAPNVPDAFSNETVGLPAGITTTLNVFATAVGGILEGQTFTVNYTDGTSQSFTQNLSDWRNPQGFANETNVVTMADYLNSSGAAVAGGTYVYGYTFTLNGKTAASITLPSTRYVVAFGFGGH